MFASHAPIRTRTAHATTGSLLSRLRLALVARAQRRALARFDARMLRDIGVSRAQAEAEANRPLWDVPASWLR
jgi:uncharacterized protein YjiS (DUF1127 family)